MSSDEEDDDGRRLEHDPDAQSDEEEELHGHMTGHVTEGVDVVGLGNFSHGRTIRHKNPDVNSDFFIRM